MRILLTAIGSFSADCVVRVLKSQGHYVVGCDIYPAEWHAVSKDLDKVFRAPFATHEEEYISFLQQVCNQEQISHLNPLTDLEIDVINRHRATFEAMGVVLCMQSAACLATARDKYALTALFAYDARINVPYSVRSEELTDDFPVPAVAKPVDGRSSEGLMRNVGKQELAHLIGRPNYIVQQQLDGTIFTVDFVRDRFGNTFSVPREELLRTKNGAGTTVRVVPDKQLLAATAYIGEKLGVVGCVNMEFIHHNDAYYLIDLNPRFSAGVAFSCFVGYDMVSSHFNALNGLAILPPADFAEQLVCKRYNEEAL